MREDKRRVTSHQPSLLGTGIKSQINDVTELQCPSPASKSAPSKAKITKCLRQPRVASKYARDSSIMDMAMVLAMGTQVT